MDNTGIILTLAYPETIVRVSDEWFSPYLSFFGIGKKNYVKAEIIDPVIKECGELIAIIMTSIKTASNK